MNHMLIGVDPGKTCGFAVLDQGVLTARDLNTYEACVMLEALLETRSPKVVAVERFTFQASSNKLTRQYDALEFIGVARYLCTKHNITLLIQGAADAARIGSPDVLRRIGWWQNGLDHANKAVAQVALAYARTYPNEFHKILEGMI